MAEVTLEMLGELMQRMLAEMREMRGEMAEMRADIRELRARISVIEISAASMQHRLDRMGGDIELIKRRLNLVEV